MENKKSWIKVKCHSCGNEQTIFARASSEIKCIKCNEILGTPRGGKLSIKAEILELK